MSLLKFALAVALLIILNVAVIGPAIMASQPSKFAGVLAFAWCLMSGLLLGLSWDFGR